jgi:hypothetical protein
MPPGLLPTLDLDTDVIRSTILDEVIFCFTFFTSKSFFVRKTLKESRLGMFYCGEPKRIGLVGGV